jgi:hypothetical protein
MSPENKFFESSSKVEKTKTSPNTKNGVNSVSPELQAKINRAKAEKLDFASPVDDKEYLDSQLSNNLESYPQTAPEQTNQTEKKEQTPKPNTLSTTLKNVALGSLAVAGTLLPPAKPVESQQIIIIERDSSGRIIKQEPVYSNDKFLRYQPKKEQPSKEYKIAPLHAKLEVPIESLKQKISNFEQNYINNTTRRTNLYEITQEAENAKSEIIKICKEEIFNHRDQESRIIMNCDQRIDRVDNMINSLIKNLDKIDKNPSKYRNR